MLQLRAHVDSLLGSASRYGRYRAHSASFTMFIGGELCLASLGCLYVADQVALCIALARSGEWD